MTSWSFESSRNKSPYNIAGRVCRDVCRVCRSKCQRATKASQGSRHLRSQIILSLTVRSLSISLVLCAARQSGGFPSWDELCDSVRIRSQWEGLCASDSLQQKRPNGKKRDSRLSNFTATVIHQAAEMWQWKWMIEADRWLLAYDWFTLLGHRTEIYGVNMIMFIMTVTLRPFLSISTGGHFCRRWRIRKDGDRKEYCWYIWNLPQTCSYEELPYYLIGCDSVLFRCLRGVQLNKASFFRNEKMSTVKFSRSN